MYRVVVLNTCLFVTLLGFDNKKKKSSSSEIFKSVLLLFFSRYNFLSVIYARFPFFILSFQSRLGARIISTRVFFVFYINLL